MARIEVMARCSDCQRLIGQFIYIPPGCIDEDISKVTYFASVGEPKYCKYCGAKFKSIFYYTKEKNCDDYLKYAE